MMSNGTASLSPVPYIAAVLLGWQNFNDIQTDTHSSTLNIENVY